MSLLAQTQRQLERSDQVARGIDSLAMRAASRIQNPVHNWPNATPLPDGLPPVAEFEFDLLPDALRRAIEDIAERMQCPPDFPAIAAMASLASLIGRRCVIAPKEADDWMVVPNLWGMAIGRPGIMKSPPLMEVLRPLQVLQARALEDFEFASAEHEASQLIAEQAERVAKDAIRQALKAGNRHAASERALEAIQCDNKEPVCKRYIVNDSTVEKLGEILNQNPNGVLLYRDELAGFFRTLEKQGHEADRAFYLECWNGDGAFTYDRIGRGTLHIEGACLSILGSIQPGPISELLRGLSGGGDDGLLQRFQLAVWPDQSKAWRNVDRIPDVRGRESLQNLFSRINGMSGSCANTNDRPVLRFSAQAQALFNVWRADLEQRLRSGEMHPMLEAHLAKYRSLVPSLALILHLADHTSTAVELAALERAIAWAEYLETHARRIYSPAIAPDINAAKELSRRIVDGDLGKQFSLRDIYNNGWSCLSTRESAAAAVRTLVDFDWLRELEEPTAGRTRTVVLVNPNIEVKEKAP